MSLASRLILAWAMLAATASFAFAIEVGNVNQGLRLARDQCAQCHAVTKGGHSAKAGATAFETLANTTGMNAMALRAALQTSHRTMPNLIVAGNDASDIIAYILSLRTGK